MLAGRRPGWALPASLADLAIRASGRFRDGIIRAMPRERVFRTEAIVLRRRDFGEADRLLTLYTPERGKISALAKGARKPTSRKAGHVELYTRTAKSNG